MINILEALQKDPFHICLLLYCRGKVVYKSKPYVDYTVKKVTVFPSPAGMSLTKLSLAGNF